jgi:tRNA-dihydrouridine synthase B
MAGVTDASYRQLIKKLAPNVIVYSEFLSTDALKFGARKTLAMMQFDSSLERPFIVQVFGKKPEHFLEAAKVVEQAGADGIDINMGCPAAKVVSSSHGSALMRNPELAAELVHAAVKSVSIPVSVKTRLGWDSADNLIPFCRLLVSAGAAALAVHGRTFTQKFSGSADWNPIYELKKQVHVPVIGNGDITCAADARAKLGNLDGVMVGRATFGNPWVMREIMEALNAPILNPSPTGGAKIESELPSPCGGRACPELAEGAVDRSDGAMTFAEKIPFILEHCRLAFALKGKKGMFEMRRHLASYVRGLPGAAQLRAKLVRVESVAEVEEILQGV